MAFRCRAGVGRADVWVGMGGAGLGALQRHPAWDIRHPGPQTSTLHPAQSFPGHKLGESASPAHLLIKTPSMFWPLLIPIKKESRVLITRSVDNIVKFAFALCEPWGNVNASCPWHRCCKGTSRWVPQAAPRGLCQASSTKGLPAPRPQPCREPRALVHSQHGSRWMERAWGLQW